MLLQEYCEKGSLEDIILAEEMELDSIFLFSIASDMAKGLAYLHKSELFVHGHMKPTNCLIDRRWTCKLNDYGLESVLAGSAMDINTEYEVYKKMLWTAPELLVETKSYFAFHMEWTMERQREAEDMEENGEETIKKKSTIRRENNEPEFPMDQLADVWGFGVSVSQMITRSMPYDECMMEPKDIIEHIESGDVSLNLDQHKENCPPALSDLILSCVEMDPDNRPTAKQCSDMITKMNPNKGSLTDNMAKMLENYAKNLENIVADRTAQLAEQTDKVQTLLYEMLPREVADKLIHSEKIEPESFDCATIFFSDIVGFTKIASKSTPIQVVDLLNMLYTSFDSTLAEFDVYKVETIGDAYMVVSGIPHRNGNDHVKQICLVSLHLMANVNELRIPHMPDVHFEMRVGIHSGFCVAGVVGIKMPRYCLFGDTVNTASRMESGGAPQRIQVSGVSETLCRQFYPGFKFSERGEMEVKGKGVMKTFWLEGEASFTRTLPVPRALPDE